MNGTVKVLFKKRIRIIAMAIFSAIIMVVPPPVRAQAPEPVVAIHVSEKTQALDPGQWWSSWHYFVMPDSLKEALRSDGTPFIEVTDVEIEAGNLLAGGSPKYPILISLAAEAIADDEIAPLLEYVNAGGILFVGSSAFTRNPDGSTRADFALASELGLHMVNPDSLSNWYENRTFTKDAEHRLVTDIPTGTLNWRMPLSAEEISSGTSTTNVSTNHVIHGNHWVFQVTADSGTTVIANGDSGPLLATRQYGKGNFIYHGDAQPLIGHGGYDPSMYAYLIYRQAIEWAFEAANLPIIKLSPWRYDYNAAFIVRHDFENNQETIGAIEDSAIFEHDSGVKGDYYFCTGTLRSEMTGTYQSNAITGLQNAVSTYGATIGSHNGGLKNPVNNTLSISDIDYWHWGPDEALDSDLTPTYANGKAYANASISQSLTDIAGWLPTLDNGREGCGSAGPCSRIWVAPYFNSTREDSNVILQDLGIVSTGEQKISPFPSWTLSTQTTGTHFSHISLPISEWYVNGDMTTYGGAMEGHTTETMQAAVDFYYNLGALTNIYAHEVSDATTLTGQYVQYAVAKPFMWAANAVEIYDWWKERSKAVVTTAYIITGNTVTAQASITGATDAGTAVEMAIPNENNQGVSNIQVLINDAPADPADYRIIGNTIKVHVGVSASSAKVQYTINNVVPTTTSLSPNSAIAGGSGFTLIVNGTGFVSGSEVRWNGSSRTTAYVSSTQLTAAIPGSDITTIGTASVTVFSFTPGGGTSNTQIFTINGAATTTDLISSSPTSTYGDSVTLTAIVSSATTTPTGSVTFMAGATYLGTVTLSTEGTATFDTSALLAGVHSLTAAYTGDEYCATSISSARIQTVNKAGQTITFDALSAKTYDDAPFTISFTVSSGLTATFGSSNLSVATIIGNEVTILSTGTTTITAYQSGDGNYNAATPVPQLLTVNKATQTITFGALSAKTYGDAPYTISSSVSSGLTATYGSSNLSVATISGSVVTILSGGTTTITAYQSGDGNYNAATPVSQILTVNKATPAVGVVSSSLTSTYGASVTFTATVSSPTTTPTGTVIFKDGSTTIGTGTLSGSGIASYVTSTLDVAGSPHSITIDYSGDTNFIPSTSFAISQVVNKANQTITFGALSIKAVGDADYAAGGSSTSGLTISYVSSNIVVAQISGVNIQILSAGTTTITASQSGNANWNAAAPVAQGLMVAAGPQSITIGTPAPPSAVFNSTFNVAATASSTLPVAITTSGGCSGSGTGSATILMTSGTTTCTVNYNQAGNADYGSASQTENITALKLSQTITEGTPAPASAEYNSQFMVAATASSGLAVSYSSGSLSVCTNSGAIFTMISASGTCVVQYDQAGDANYSAATRVTKNTTAGKASQTITINTHAPASAEYNSQFTVAATASSGLEVSYSSGSLSVCTNSGAIFTMISASGTCVVQYDQAGDTNYIAATRVTENTTAGKASQTITFNPPTTKNFGDASFDLSATGGASGNSITFAVTSGPGTIAGNTLTIDDVGAIVITASQAGDSNYNAAADVQKTITVPPNGELNGDNIVDIADALKALRIAAGLDTSTASDIAHGDVAPLVNGIRTPDGKIDLNDVVAILRKAVNLPSW